MKEVYPRTRDKNNKDVRITLLGIVLASLRYFCYKETDAQIII
jgi:hypothetical protein